MGLCGSPSPTSSPAPRDVRAPWLSNLRQPITAETAKKSQPNCQECKAYSKFLTTHMFKAYLKKIFFFSSEKKTKPNKNKETCFLGISFFSWEYLSWNISSSWVFQDPPTTKNWPNGFIPWKKTNQSISLNGSAEPEKAMAAHSSTLAPKIPWMEEPGRLQSMGSRRVGHD